MALPLLPAAGSLLKSAALSKAKSAAVGAAKKKAVPKTPKVDSQKLLSAAPVSAPQRKRVTSGRLLPVTTSPDALKDTTTVIRGPVSYQVLGKRLDNLVETTSKLDTALKEQYQKKASLYKKLLVSRKREQQKKEEKELESGKKKIALGLGITKAIGGFNPLDFLTNFLTQTLLGGIAVLLVKNYDKIVNNFDTLSSNLYLIYNGIRASLGLLRFGFKGALSITKNLLKGVVFNPIKGGITRLLRATGNLLGSGLSKIGNAIYNFAHGIYNKIRVAAGLRPEPRPTESTNLTPGAARGGATGGARSTAGFRSPGRYRSPGQARAGGEFSTAQARRNLSSGRATVRPGSLAARTRQLQASLQTGTAFGGRAAGLQRGVYRAGTKVSPFLSRLFGRKTAEGLASASPALKNVSKAARSIRIPILGPMIVAVSGMLSGEPPKKIAYKAIGAGLGEALGTLIPIPVLGTIIGGLIGEYGGDLLYTYQEGGGLAGIKAKMSRDFQAALTAGGKVVDWVKSGFGRYLKAVPQMDLPFVGKVPDIRWMLNPFNIVDNANRFVKAFFPGDSGTEQVGETTVQPVTGLMSSAPSAPAAPTSVPAQGSGVASGNLNITGAKTTYYDPALGGINASGIKTPDGLPATSTGEGYRPEVFSAAAFPPLLAMLPQSMTVPARGFPGGRTLKKPFHVIVTNSQGKRAVLRVNDVGPGVEGHSPNHMLDLSVAAKNYLGTGGGFSIQMASADSSPGPLGTGEVAPTTPGNIPGTKIPQPQQRVQGGLSNVVPQTNLQKIGAGSGPIGRSSERGMRNGRHHGGIDIGTSGQKGWYVAFKMAGKVSLVKTLSGYGKTVFIKSGNLEFIFAHLNTIMVKQGDKYDGQVIGEIGNTGRSFGEHLHFEVRPAGGGSGTDVDPNPYVKYLEIGRLDPQATRAVIDRQAQGPSRSQSVSARASYEQGAPQSVVIPLPGRDSGGGVVTLPGGGVSVIGGSTADLVNSYYKAQLLGFLYKQG